MRSAARKEPVDICGQPFLVLESVAVEAQVENSGIDMLFSEENAGL